MYTVWLAYGILLVFCFLVFFLPGGKEEGEGVGLCAPLFFVLVVDVFFFFFVALGTWEL